MGVHGGAVNQYVIKKDYHTLPKEGLKYNVHRRLQSRRGVGQSEWHYKKFEMPIMRSESSLKDISLVHPDLVVYRS